MKRWTTLSVLIAMLLAAVAISGCTGGPAEPLNISNYQRIAVAPFSTEKEAAEMAMRFPYDLATRLSLVKKEKEWIFDQSDELSPVGTALKAQGLSPKDIFLDPALAAKVGQAVNADLIVVGHIYNPKIEEEKDNEPVFDMSNQAGISGTTRFVLVYQWATLRMHVKAIDAKTGNMVWDNGGFTGYTKYIREFQTQDPAKDYSRISEEQMRADIRKHMLNQIGHQIAPDVIAERPIPDILMKPDRPLIKSGGKPIL
jgi:hypothetical protein